MKSLIIAFGLLPLSTFAISPEIKRIYEKYPEFNSTIEIREITNLMNEKGDRLAGHVEGNNWFGKWKTHYIELDTSLKGDDLEYIIVHENWHDLFETKLTKEQKRAWRFHFSKKKFYPTTYSRTNYREHFAEYASFYYHNKFQSRSRPDMNFFRTKDIPFVRLLEQWRPKFFPGELWRNPIKFTTFKRKHRPKIRRRGYNYKRKSKTYRNGRRSVVTRKIYNK